jgi:6-phosphogluconolactonase
MAEAVTGAAGEPRVVVAADPGALADAAAALVRRGMARAIEDRGACHVALAGGRTPKGVYERLATAGDPAIDWGRVHVAFGDERLVAPDHPESNYAMARAALLDRVPVPPAQVVRVRGELEDAAAAAEAYATALAAAFGLAPGAWPVFDVVLLGIGADGHTASLFPHTPALHERGRIAAAAQAPVAPSRRVTLTFPVLNAARAIFVLTSGADKAPAVARALAPEGDWEACPVRAIRPGAGTLTWLLDAAAAAALPRAEGAGRG